MSLGENGATTIMSSSSSSSSLPSVTLDVTYENFLIAFKFVIGNAIVSLDYATYNRSFHELQQLLNVVFYTHYSSVEKTTVMGDRLKFNQLTKEGSQLQQRMATWSVEYIEALHNMLHHQLLDDLIAINYTTKRQVIMLWEPTRLGSRFGPRTEPVGWNGVDSLFIWIWIHITSLHASATTSTAKQNEFLGNVKSIIMCHICFQHYTQRLPALLSGIRESYSVYIALLKLHSYIQLAAGRGDQNLDTITVLNVPINIAYDIRYKGLYNYIYGLFRAVSNW